MKTLFDFDDIQIQGSASCVVESRSEINPYTIDDFLPLIASPMDTVICDRNRHIFHQNKIYTTSVRRKDFCLSKSATYFQAMSLHQFDKFFINKDADYNLKKPIKILIDIANGHMNWLARSIQMAKKIHGDSLQIMAGNIANPKTYYILNAAGADYVRLGVGTGNGCLTTVHTGVGWPLASLVEECKNIKEKEECDAAIVADGGMKNYDDVIKALALGADFVMAGSIFNKALESAGTTYVNEKIVNQFADRAKQMYDEGVPFYKEYRGMSTKAVQRAFGNEVIKTSEGIETIRPVEYTISGWVENFEHYLRTAMSYTNCKTLAKFKENTTFNFITQNALLRIRK